jgi:hypothetical protein
MKCIWCDIDARFRFCSDKCFLEYAKTRTNVTCAICQYDPKTGDIGNHSTNRLCDDCRAGEENAGWREPSDYEQTAEDVDVTAAAAGGDRLEAVFGGKRKGDSEMAARVVKIALHEQVTRRRRRRNRNGEIVRGWTTAEEQPSLRDIAQKAGCSHEYARKVLKRVLD